MRLCLVGYGAIAGKHMEAFSEIADIEPYVLVGRRQEPTAEFAAKWGFGNYILDYHQALSDPNVDLVVITSPNAMHVEQAEAALQAGKHVLLEIPIALNLSEAERITRLSRQSGQRFMVAHTMRFFPALREVHRRVRDGELRIHQIIGFLGLMRRTNVTAAGKPRSWVDDLLWHLGAHLVDAALWVTGNTQAANLSCRFGPKHATQGIMDLSLGMTLPSGELVTINHSFNVSELRWTMTFIAEEDTLEFNMNGLYASDGREIVPQRSVVDLRDQNHEFIVSIQEGRDPAVTGEDVLPAMRILDRAQSIALGS
jgi:2-hydroxy-4-carboxymuconate semialdehyde hemiacetal dehydrogenase